MANQTSTFAVDSSGPVNVVAQSVCRRITIQENYNSVTPPTQNLLVAAPAGATAVNVAQGVPFIFTPLGGGNVNGGRLYAGQIVGTVQTVAGSITMQQIESDWI